MLVLVLVLALVLGIDSRPQTLFLLEHSQPTLWEVDRLHAKTLRAQRPRGVLSTSSLTLQLPLGELGDFA